MDGEKKKHTSDHRIISSDVILGDTTDDVDSSKFPMTTLAGVALVILVAVSGWIFFVQDPLTDNQYRDDIQNFQGLAESSRARDYENAIVRANELLQEDIPHFARIDTQLLLALNLFRTGEVGKQREAIKIAKTIATDVNASRQRRADAVNRILSIYYSGRSPHVFDEIFSGKPFSELYKGDSREAIRRVAAFSMDLFPTASAAFRMAVWYSGELLDNPGLSDETRARYISEIENALATARALYEQDLTPSPLYAASYHHWRGFFLGVLAREGSKDARRAFEDTFKTALDVYDPNAVEGSVVLTTSAYTYFYYAAFLNEVYDDGRIDDQRLLLRTLSRMITENPELYRSGFIDFMTVERDRLPETRDHNYQWFIDLAENSEDFAALLGTYGWNLNE